MLIWEVNWALSVPDRSRFTSSDIHWIPICPETFSGLHIPRLHMFLSSLDKIPFYQSKSGMVITFPQGSHFRINGHIQKRNTARECVQKTYLNAEYRIIK